MFIAHVLLMVNPAICRSLPARLAFNGVAYRVLGLAEARPLSIAPLLWWREDSFQVGEHKKISNLVINCVA
jgi:hypothetical protein